MIGQSRVRELGRLRHLTDRADEGTALEEVAGNKQILEPDIGPPSLRPSYSFQGTELAACQSCHRSFLMGLCAPQQTSL